VSVVVVADRVLYWIDINAPALNRFDPATGENRVMPMPASIGCAALRDDGGSVALRTGIWLASAGGNLERSVAPPYEPAITSSTTAASITRAVRRRLDEREPRRGRRRALPARCRLR
jgi:sugar lactone lactonase YvrE